MLQETFDNIVILCKETTTYLNLSRIQDWDTLIESFCLSLLMLVIVFMIELCYTGWKESSLRKLVWKPSRSAITDIVMYFIYISGAISVLAILTSMGIPQFIKATAYHTVGLQLGLEMHSLGHLFLYLVILDFFNYWQHRLLHRYPTFWHIHAFHHSATEFSVMTVFREHPLNKALHSFASLIPAVLLGVPTAEYPIYITAYGIVGYLKHSRIPWRLGWFGKYIIQSPVDHWIHHSNQPEHYDRNFANVFSIWDHLFGTYYDGSEINARIGLDNAPYNKYGVIQDMVTSQALFIKSIWLKIRPDKNQAALPAASSS
jgi:sterol desaturase/sphingolipid hydroxylase (fatty acid hydroxylase superfamily)